MVDLHREQVGRRAIGDISVYRQIVGRRRQENDLALALSFVLAVAAFQRIDGLVADRQSRITSDRWWPMKTWKRPWEVEFLSQFPSRLEQHLQHFPSKHLRTRVSETCAAFTQSGREPAASTTSATAEDPPRRPQTHRLSLRSERYVHALQ
jgi:hypothetical protein